jgi:hypothetical protein
MQNIHVGRYKTPGTGYQGWIEPEDKSWLVFIDDKGLATFWRCCETTNEEGKTVRGYIDAELPISAGVKLPTENHDFQTKKPESSKDLWPLDFEVTPMEPGAEAENWPGLRLDSVPVEHVTDPQTGKLVPVTEAPKKGFWATLNKRMIACFGETEHEAIRNLMNSVAQLCTAGCLDHTGNPAYGHHHRRYDAVFGGPGIPRGAYWDEGLKRYVNPWDAEWSAEKYKEVTGEDLENPPMISTTSV